MKTNKLMKLVALVLALAMVFSLAACSDGSGNSSASTSTAEGEGGDNGGYKLSGPPDTSETYEFTQWYYYNWIAVPEWGSDEVSQWYKDKFNIIMHASKPDQDGASILASMLAANTLPEALVLDKNADFLKVARGGYLVPINDLKYPGCSYDEDLTEVTQELLAVDGVNYAVPNWPRKAATGGNNIWMVNKKIWEDQGSPKINTLEELHDFLLAVKEKGYTAVNGASVIPVHANNSVIGWNLLSAIYRSLGAPNLVATYYSQINNKIEYFLKDPVLVEAARIMNQWYREGLWSTDQFTDSSDVFNEKLSNGQVAALYYDFSQDDSTHFKTNLEEADPGNTYLIAAYDEEFSDNPYLPAEGVDFTWGEENNTVGWLNHVITKNAEKPERIFDWLQYMLSWEGSAVMQYGPPGNSFGTWNEWVEVDGVQVPKIEKAVDLLSSDEQTKLGSWKWNEPAHSDNVDLIKYLVNRQMPDAEKNPVATIQDVIFTTADNGQAAPESAQKVLTDENTNIADVIDPDSDDANKRQAVQDATDTQMAFILQAATDEEFDQLVQKLLDDVEARGVSVVEEAYTAKRAENIELQGYTAYQRYYDAHQ